MDHVSDFTKDEEQIILDLINHDNGTSFTTEVSLGFPRKVGQAVDVLVSPTQGSGYGGPLDVTYNRLAIQDFIDLFEPSGLSLVQGSASTIGDLLPEINTALGINLPRESIEDLSLGEWAGTPGETKNLSLQVKMQSRVYYGNGAFTLHANPIQLVDVLPNRVLNGFDLPDPLVELESLFNSNIVDLY